MAALTDTRKGKVLLGDLPEDFLRLPLPSADNATISPQHLQNATLDRSLLSRIEVSLAEARLVKNYGVGRMNLYCRLRIGARVELTQTGNHGKNPRWNHNVRCRLHPGVSTILIEVLDQRTFSEDERVAWTHIELTEPVLAGESVLDNWFDLNGKQGTGAEGQIKLVVSVTPPPAAAPATFGAQQTQLSSQPQMQVPPQVHQPQQQQQHDGRPIVRISREELQSVLDMFPTLEKEVVVSVLEASGGDMDATITSLLAISSTD